jgi:hypothetical protein
MHMCDAMIDVESGNPIVVGKIALQLGKRPRITLPEHTHLLLDIRNSARSLLVFRAITQITRLDNGFYAVTTTEPRIEVRSLGPDAMGSVPAGGLSRDHAGTRTVFEASSCGELTFGGMNKLYDVPGFELLRQFGPDGMTFLLSGLLSTARINKPDTSLPANAGFEIRGLIQWATLRLLDLPAGKYYTEFVPEAFSGGGETSESLGELDPFSLADLRPCSFLAKALVAGHLRFVAQPTHRIVSLSFNGPGLFLQDCERIRRTEDGFSYAAAGEKMWFHSPPITLAWIEQLLPKRNDAASVLSGDGIGTVSYQTNDYLEPGLRENILLEIDRLELKASLSYSGLRLDFAAALGEARRTVSISESVRTHSTLKEFYASATLPWSLLLVMGSRLAARRTGFVEAAGKRPG